MKKVIVVAGPTGTGKTKKAIELAKDFARDFGSTGQEWDMGSGGYGAELINADSRQVYKYLRIGTNTGDIVSSLSRERARESDFEPNFPSSLLNLRGESNSTSQYYIEDIPIHLISFLDLDQQYNVFEWKKAAEKVIQEIFDRGNQPIVVGGTGLYIDALVKNYNLESVDRDENLRKELEGLELLELQERLQSTDQDVFDQLNESDKQNPVRLIRLIEKAQLNQTPPTHSSTQEGKPKWQFEIYYPNYDWDDLKKKITDRVDEMFRQGLLQEAEFVVRTLKKVYVMSTAEILETNVANIMGYKQIFESLGNKISGEVSIPTNNELYDLIESVATAHRQYARRQRTWFERGGRYKVGDFIRF